MQKITPFLWFDTQAEEAMNFYVAVFKNSPGKKSGSKVVSIKRYPQGPLEGPMKGMEDKVLTGVFQLHGQRFMALDGGPHFKFTEAVSLYVECKDQKEVDYFWEKLGEGGDKNAQQCGWLKDKFGLSWQIIPAALPKYLNDKDPKKSGRAMQALLQMKKIEIAGLKKAYEGN